MLKKITTAVFLLLILFTVTGCIAGEKTDPFNQQILKAEDAKTSIFSDKFFNSVDTIELKDVSDGTATAKAWIKNTSEQTIHKVVATNLPKLEDDYFYEGWLVQKAPGLDFFSTGELKYSEETNEWILTYTSDEIKADYDFVVITLEKKDNDPSPDVHILESR